MGDKKGLTALCTTFYHEVEALFGDDPDIHVEYDADKVEITLIVQNADKADALAQILPTEKAFGDVTLKLNVKPIHKPITPKTTLIARAFQGNPAYSYAISTEWPGYKPIYYIVFANKVVQFFNDNHDDVNGNCTTLYQDIARDVLGTDENIRYCTDVANSSKHRSVH